MITGFVLAAIGAFIATQSRKGSTALALFVCGLGFGIIIGKLI